MKVSRELDRRSQTWTFLAVRVIDLAQAGLDEVLGPQPGIPHLLLPSRRKGLQPERAALLARLGAQIVSVRRDEPVQTVIAFPSAEAALGAAVLLLEGGQNHVDQAQGLGLGLATGEAPEEARLVESGACRRAIALAEISGIGQALIATATYEVVRDSAADEFGFHECGTVRLDGQIRRERVYQLMHPSLAPDLVNFVSGECVVNTLPPSMGYFLGREIEIVQTLQAIHATRVVQVVGGGGIGKSHLAWRVATDLLDSNVEGVLWISLLGCRTQEQLLDRMSEHLDSIRIVPNSIRMDVGKQLRGRNLLVVLDGCDGCAAAASSVLRTLCASSGPKFITTSCKRIPFPDSATVRLGAMQLPPDGERLSDEDLDAYEATALFVDRAKDIRSSFSVEGEIEAIAEICRKLNGHPLAIVLAAAKTKTQRPSQILAHLGAIIGHTAPDNKADEAGRQKSLRAALRFSLQSLEPVAARLLSRTSLIEAAWSPLDAAVMTDLDLEEIETALDDLLDAGMIEEVEGPNGHRGFRMPSQVANYARTLLSPEELHEARERHCLRFVDLLAQVSKDLNGAHQRHQLDLLDFYLQDMVRAFEYMIAEGRHLVSFVDAMTLSWTFWYRRNRISEALKLIDCAVRCKGLADRTGKARLLNMAGVLTNKVGDSLRARGYYQRAMQYAHGSDLHLLLPSITTNLGILEWSEASPEKGLQLLNMAIQMWRELEQPYRIGQAMVSAVSSLVESGKAEEAREYLHRAVDFGFPSGDAQDQWAFELSSGQVEVAQGNFKEAMRRIANSVCHAREMGDETLIARSFLWLAQASLDCGQVDLAATLLGATAEHTSSAESHLYRTSELRIARIEGRARTSLGDERLRELKIMGALTDVDLLLTLLEAH